mmetsp:Transcript_16581/g.64738  ORF Transcript_16581/g.64738 Transcript_16581/m.64738 type:complete len:231 (-) Transcript_16581:1851-2543(-)
MGGDLHEPRQRLGAGCRGAGGHQRQCPGSEAAAALAQCAHVGRTGSAEGPAPGAVKQLPACDAAEGGLVQQRQLPRRLQRRLRLQAALRRLRRLRRKLQPLSSLLQPPRQLVVCEDTQCGCGIGEPAFLDWIVAEGEEGLEGVGVVGQVCKVGADPLLEQTADARPQGLGLTAEVHRQLAQDQRRRREAAVRQQEVQPVLVTGLDGGEGLDECVNSAADDAPSGLLSDNR